MMRAGGAKNLPSFSADDLIAASLSFPDTVQQHPYPMLAKLASYNTIAGSLSLTATQEAFIAPLFRVYRRAMQYSGDLAYLRSHTSEFRTLSLPQAPAAALAAPAKVPQTAALEEWNSYSVAKASDQNYRMSLLLENKQMVVSTDFNFNDINKDDVDQTTNNWEALLDDLSRLAKGCLNEPKNRCSGNVPQEPARIRNLVRVFPVQKDWNTAAGPVSITLDSSYVCKVDNILGNWRIADAENAPVASCNNLPHQVTNGYIIQGGFDSYYQDNHGTCTYQLMCYRR
jgi:hypothetical protein